MKQLVKIYQKYNNFFHINWFITNKCNFSCEYCHPFNYANTSPKFDINVYKNFIHRILNQIGNKQLIISFTGGEPTSLDWFDEFLDFLIENNVKIGLTSNGSKSIKWWKKYRKAFDWVSLSFHAEKSNISHFINIIDTIWSHSLVSVRVMMHPKDEYFKKGITLYKTLKTKPFITVISVEKVIIIDDVVATGGTALASIKLLEKLRANIVNLSFLINLTNIPKKNKLITKKIKFLISY